MDEKYTDLVANAYKEIKMWRSVTIFVGIIALGLAVLLINKGLQETLILVPYEMGANGAITSERKEIKLDRSGLSDEYLRYVALADLSLILNWNPGSVIGQYGQFLNRVTSELYAKTAIEMLAEANRYAKSSNSQVFYPEGKVEANKDTGAINVSGRLIRWAGEKKIFDEKVQMRMKYAPSKGMLYVAELSIG